ncbi:MAG: LysR family transcriptional regulator [Acidimicrobiales bacterium]
MELRQVAYVVAAVDHGGFTRAAACIPVSQPSLSAGIRSLERELGVDLFARIGRGVRLTAAGEAFLGPARQILRDADTATEAVAAVAGLHAGHLDIVALPTLAIEPLVDLLATFHEAHPEVRVRVTDPQSAGDASAAVRTGAAEIGLVELPAGADLVEVALSDQEVLAVQPPESDHRRGRVATRRLPVRRLAGAAFVATPPGTSMRALIDEALDTAGVAADVAVETAHREALLPLVMAGAGTAFLPEPMARRAAEAGAVVSKLDPPIVRSVGLVHRSGPLSPAAAAFVASATAAPAQAGGAGGGRARRSR